jgi:ubiquinone/menaquinone biosynthesis C-methylase UbiE
MDVILLFYDLHDLKSPDSIVRELDRILKTKGTLAVIDHKFDVTKVVFTINHVTSELKISDRGESNNKSKDTLLVFSNED